jgi:polar amino acid transport system substrate-binding protein
MIKNIQTKSFHQWLTFSLLLYVQLNTLISYKVSSKELVVGVEAVSYYPLYAFNSKDVIKDSFSKELLATFFEEYHYEYRFQALPIKRFNKWYIEETIDFKFPDNVRWRDDETSKLAITYSDSVVELNAGGYVLSHRPFMKRSEIKVLGTILGFYPTLWTDLIASEQVKLFESNSPLSLVKHLLHGNVDVLNIDHNVIRHHLTLLNKQGYVTLNPQLKHIRYAYHLSSIQYPEIIQQFNTFLKKNQLWIKTLKSKYGIDENFALKL